MKHLVIAFLYCLVLIPAVASALPADTLRLYYRIDQMEIISTKKLDSLVLRAQFLERKITVIGYADFLGTKGYNSILALARAKNIQGYLQKRLNDFEITAEGKGEVIGFITSGLQGDSLYRRVDVIYNLKQQVLIQDTTFNKPSVKPAPAKKDSVIYEGSNLPAKQKINNLSKLNIGEAISLDEITFQPGRHYLREAAIPYLVEVLQVLKKNKKLRIQIQGHICCETDGRDGLDIDEGTTNLSVNRALFIYEYFIKKGINPERLSYVGFGSSQPKVFPERNPLDQIKNRRVVFLVVGK